MKETNIADWWENYLETKRQENELKNRIKSDLEAKAEFYKQYLARCYKVQPLSEKHRDIIGKLEHNFDGKANQALIRRFEKNQSDLTEINNLYMDIYENIKLKSWFW
ncbi:hypothetical protein [Sediminibacillus halophilus]|uniref:Uncharacterized protein n=1 Tax=Sediminibacillus halophilus TaxID=482461 RepID=A0A1G9V600_9BACI|nr:hypothetical protein [Sediminibacillus halophilus]SDM67628.1 hypothetical protein SAMN05216244_3148 [Sediminibacillus halophilus]